MEEYQWWLKVGKFFQLHPGDKTKSKGWEGKCNVIFENVMQVKGRKFYVVKMWFISSV